MENVITAIICLSLILTAAISLAGTYLDSANMLLDTAIITENRLLQRRGTAIDIVSVAVSNGGSDVDLRVKNAGSKSLSNFGRWDIIVKYADGNILYLQYGTSRPGWSVTGIYYSGSPETYEPGILNPDEELAVRLQLALQLSPSTTNYVTICTDNGVADQTAFSWEP